MKYRISIIVVFLVIAISIIYSYNSYRIKRKITEAKYLSQLNACLGISENDPWSHIIKQLHVGMKRDDIISTLNCYRHRDIKLDPEDFDKDGSVETIGYIYDCRSCLLVLNFNKDNELVSWINMRED